MSNEQIYSRRGYVCWPIKIGGFSGNWPLGKVEITSEHISLSILFWSHRLIKSDIENIEFVSSVSSYLFYFRLLSKNKLCKITLKNGSPKWLAFATIDKDLIIGRLGTLDNDYIELLNSNLIKVLKLTK